MFYVTCDQGHYIGKHIRQCPVMPVNPTERKHPVDAHRGPRHPQWPKNELMHANLLDLLFIFTSQSILFLNKTISCSLKLESMSVCQLACCHLIPVVHEASAQEPTPVASKGWWRCWWRDMSNARHCNITLSQNLRTWLAEASVDPQQQNLVVHVVDPAFSQLCFDQLSSKLIIWQRTHFLLGHWRAHANRKKWKRLDNPQSIRWVAWMQLWKLSPNLNCHTHSPSSQIDETNLCEKKAFKEKQRFHSIFHASVESQTFLMKTMWVCHFEGENMFDGLKLCHHLWFVSFHPSHVWNLRTRHALSHFSLSNNKNAFVPLAWAPSDAILEEIVVAFLERVTFVKHSHSHQNTTTHCLKKDSEIWKVLLVCFLREWVCYVIFNKAILAS